MTLLAWVYTIATVCLSVFGLNLLLLTGIQAYYWLQARRARYDPDACSTPAQAAAVLPEPVPLVTIQLPLYNEKQVARRLINSVAQMDYPRERLQIQVLDDSTDETCEIVDECARRWQEQGCWIEVLRRKDRKEYKAGALRAGLNRAAGEFVAIFDADFAPQPDWLKQALPPFFEPGSERIGLVQTRWGHLNEDYSVLTRAQALALDGHFAVEQNARYTAGLFLTFNGTAGIWRRACIDSAGNWRGLTLSEDLDLSYRAQLKGWKICYRPDISVPAEIPVQMAGLKRQQFRWAKGTIQVARLLVPEMLRSRITPWKKLQGVLHLSAYVAHPLMIVVLLLMLPLNLWGYFSRHHDQVNLLGIAGLGAPLLYAFSQTFLYGRHSLGRWLARMPLLFLLGVGIAANNTRAVLEALFGVYSPFERTPKTGMVRRDRQRPPVRGERIKIGLTTWLELALAGYTIVMTLILLHTGNWVGAVFAAVATLGFAWVSLATLWEARGA